MIRKTLAILGIVLAVLVAGVLLFAATRPGDFRVQRSASIKAPPEKIFPLINDLKGFGTWSPFENKDPAMKRSFSGPAAGKGAVYEWDGDRNVGQGRMEIAESVAPSKVGIKLDFVRPLEGHNVVVFTLDRQGDATKVTWDMQGPMPYVSKVITVFCDMNAMIGKEFETGLANLKVIAEK